MYEYYVVIDDIGNGCDAETSFVAQIDVINSPSATIATEDSVCYEGSNLSLITSAIPGTGASGVITNSYWEIIDDVTNTVVWDDLPGNSSLIVPTFTTSIWNALQQGVGPKTYRVELTISNDCGIYEIFSPITINPRPQPAFVVSSGLFGNNCLTTQIEPVIYAGTTIDIILNGIGSLEATPLPPSCPGSTASCPSASGGPDGNTDWLVLTAQGSSSPGPSQIDPVCNGSYINMNWPDPNPNLAPCNAPPISLTYNSAVTYDICLEGYNTNTYQCPPETYCCSITVISSTVTSYFTVLADEGCEDENFVFTDLSTYDPNNVTKWCFDIDPSTGLPNPGSSWTPTQPQSPTPNQYNHQFNDPGCYYVGLSTVNTVTGNPSTYIHQDALGNDKPFIIYPKPNTNFIPEDFCVNVEDTLFDITTFQPLTCFSNGDEIISRVWEVSSDNGLTWISTPPILPTETTFVYTFPSAGEWLVRLTCTSLNLCDSTIEHQITVHDSPQAGFISSSNPSCIGDSVNFDGSINVTGGSQNAWTGAQIVEWDWNFDDPRVIPNQLVAKI